MQVPSYFRTAIVVIAFALPFSLCAQTISNEEKTSAIQTIAKHIATRYVFPEQGGQIASHLQQANFRGDFHTAKSWEEFDAQVTASIRKVSNDPHLYVQYSPEQVKLLNPTTGGNENRMYISDNTSSNSSAVVAESQVMDDNIGYLKISSFNISEASLPSIYEAMKAVHNTRALVVDLRDNTGGGSSVGPVLESFFVVEGTPLLEFTNRSGEVRKMNSVNWLKEKRYDKPLYILVNRNTASAAEAFAFALQQAGRAKVIGESTAGAAYMNEWFAVGDHSFVSVSTSVPHFSGTDRNWQGTGVRPDIKVKKGEALAIATQQVQSQK